MFNKVLVPVDNSGLARDFMPYISQIAKLEQANADLAEEMAGPGQAELELRQKDAAQKREAFIDLSDGPDPFQVALKTAQVSASLAKVEDALEDLLGSTLRAPFDGRVSLVNLEIDDPVNDESRVMELIDPRQVEVGPDPQSI